MRLMLLHPDDCARQALVVALTGIGATIVEAVSTGEALRAQRWFGHLDAVIAAAMPGEPTAALVTRLRQAQAELPVIAVCPEGPLPPATLAIDEVQPARILRALEELGLLHVQLPASRKRLDLALPVCDLGHAHEGLVLLAGNDGRVVYLNRIARDVLGLDEQARPHLADLAPAWAAPFPGGEPAGEVDVRLPGGRRMRACQTYARVVDAQGTENTIIALRPMETHCPRLGEVAASEERFRVLLEELHVGVVVQDTADRILLSNSMACELLGLTREQLHGKSSFDPEWHVIREDGTPFRPEEHPSVVAMRTKRAVHEVVMGVYRPRTRDRVWILVSAEPIVTAADEIDRIIVTFSDVSRYKAVKDRLALAHRLQGIGTLAAGIGHDFNNLLTAMMSSAEYLLMTSDDEVREIADGLLLLAERGAALTRKLRTVAHELPVRPEHVELDTLVHEFAPLMRRALPKTVTLTTTFGAAGRTTWVDPSELERVILNLVTNARDAQPRGGEIQITTREAPGEDGTTPGIELAVSDRGGGIPPEAQAFIFEPMFSTKGPERGTGLGLATAYSVVTKAAGTIGFETSPGGTTFRIWLPASAPTTTRPPPRASADPTQQTPVTGRILVVDDDPVTLDAIRRALTEARFEVTTTTSADEAWELLQATPSPRIDLILVDVVMPGMSGWQLRERCRAAGGPSVLMMTGERMGAVDEAPAVEDPMLWKPFSRERLVEAVRARLKPS